VFQGTVSLPLSDRRIRKQEISVKAGDIFIGVFFGSEDGDGKMFFRNDS
jgi:hypothetical protein